jgi:hypothetical protein
MSVHFPIHHSLPPPLELRDDELVVGRIDGDVVLFHGFDSAGAAARAAAVAHQAMLRRLARGNGGTPSASESDPGAARRASDGPNTPANARPVASVLRSGDADFAFEIRVPAPIDEVRVRSMAYVMYRALRSSGITWPRVRPVAAPEALTELATRTAYDIARARAVRWKRRLASFIARLGGAGRRGALPRMPMLSRNAFAPLSRGPENQRPAQRVLP